MKITIAKAITGQIDDCVKILQDSVIGNMYFSDYEKAKTMLVDAVYKNSLYTALSADNECLGFIYYMSNGVFGSYPYLHIIAVKETHRSQGIGKQLIKHFEENSSNYTITKCFLTVDDFNPIAKKFYENLGYQCVGALPDFYRKGSVSYLMMKEISK